MPRRQSKAKDGTNRGRKSFREKYRALCEAAEQGLADSLPELIKKAIELALGGSESMLKYCIDRSLGKPTESVDLTTDGEPIKAYYGIDLDKV